MKCLKCYLPTDGPDETMHANCARAVFGTADVPRLSLPPDSIEDRAREQLRAGRGLTGVQRKFSADLDRADKRIILGDVMSGYLIKPQTPDYPNLPEIEALTMRLAELANLDVAPSTLLRTDEGELVYVTRRVDRLDDGTALRQEDMAQLTDRLTEDKYRGSHEQVGKAIKQYCTIPRLEQVKYFRSVLFCYLTGNNDAHLKNWSLTRQLDGKWALTPLYDQVAVRLVLSEKLDPEELALPLLGRRSKFTLDNFLAFAKTLELPEVVARAQIKVLLDVVSEWQYCIANSFLSMEMKEDFLELVEGQVVRID